MRDFANPWLPAAPGDDLNVRYADLVSEPVKDAHIQCRQIASAVPIFPSAHTALLRNR